MAEEAGKGNADRLSFLLERAGEFSFYQAVRWLERLSPGSPRLGHEGPPESESVRLRPSVSLSFPPADLEEIKPQQFSDKIQITTTFFGLYGADTPLPYAYAEHIAQISSEHYGRRVRAYLDIFHHRLLSMLYRSWEKYRPDATSEGRLDPLFARAISFIGYNRELGLGGDALPRLSEVRLKVLRHRSASGLKFLLQKRLGYGVDIDQLVARTVQVPEDQLSRLGEANCELGSSLVAGRRIRDCNKIRIKVEAEDFSMFSKLLPGKPDFSNIQEVMATYLHDETDHDVEVRLAAEKIPAWELGSGSLALGESMWLGKPREDAMVRWSAPVRGA